MAKDLEIYGLKWNKRSIENLYGDSAIQGDLGGRAANIAYTAERYAYRDGAGYRVASRPGRHMGRYYWVVATDNEEAAIEEAESSTLLKAYDAGR